MSGLLLTALLLLGGNQPAAGPEAQARDPNKKICKSFAITGSRLGKKKICMTAAEWEQNRQEMARELQRAGSNANPRAD